MSRSERPAAADDTTGAGACDACGGQVADDGYCMRCGVRAVEAATVEDRGPVASATHRGLRHERNEDAVALAATDEGWPVLVVADGVSLSPNPHLAAAAAVAAAADELAGRPFAGESDLARAVAAAHRAASEVPADGDPHWPDWPDGEIHPACTFVVAVAAGETVHAANVGDARAYVLTPADGGWVARQLTTDDSVAALAVREGVEPALALALPGGHAITAWLGGDAPPPEPHLAVHRSAPGDLLLACSDGLWNDAPTEDGFSRLVDALLPAPPEARPAAAVVVEGLVWWAIDQGGSDNITLALAPVGRRAPVGGGAPDGGEAPIGGGASDSRGAPDGGGAPVGGGAPDGEGALDGGGAPDGRGAPDGGAAAAVDQGDSDSGTEHGEDRS